MSYKIGFVKGFYDQFGNFMQEMIAMFPDDPDFRTFETFLKMLSKTNPMHAIKLFKEYCDKFENQINSRDENFFLNYSYDQEEGLGDMMDVVGKLSGYYKGMNEESKKSIWEYLFVLKELSKRAVA